MKKILLSGLLVVLTILASSNGTIVGGKDPKSMVVETATATAYRKFEGNKMMRLAYTKEEPAKKSVPTRYVNHRGNTMKAPENSLPAFKKAKGTAIETDIRLTADRQWVVMHDSTIDRTTTGKGRVKDYTVDQLKDFKINTTMNFTKKELKIPTLEDFLKICQQTGKSPFIEIKDKSATVEELNEIINLLNKYGFGTSAVRVISFHYKTLRKISKLNTNYSYYLLVKDIDKKTIKQARKLGENAGINTDYLNLNKTKVKQAHKAGLEVGAYTVLNNDFLKVVALNVDYITTDQMK